MANINDVVGSDAEHEVTDEGRQGHFLPYSYVILAIGGYLLRSIHNIVKLQ